MPEKITPLKQDNPLVHFDEDNHTHSSMKAFIASIILSYRYRSGWLRKGRDIPKESCETVAEHILGMIMLDEVIQFTFPEFHQKFDELKVLNLIKRHELCEILGEDYNPGHNLSKKKKHELEQVALVEWVELLPVQQVVMKDWLEYQEAKTPVARYVHVLDYMQRAIRAVVYGKEFHKDMSEFYSDRKEKIPQPLLSFFETALDI